MKARQLLKLLEIDNKLIADIEALTKKYDSKDIGMGDSLQDLMDAGATPQAFADAFMSLAGKRDDWYDAYNAEGDHNKADQASLFDNVIRELKDIAKAHNISLGGRKY